MRRPTTYEDWMSELQAATSIEDDPITKLPGILTAATMMGKLSQNPKEVRHDIALILAIKYREEMGRANGRTMLTTPIEKKYDTIARVLFKSKFSSLLNYVITNEPGFDPTQGKTPLGFVGAKVTYDEKGNVRAPLGFIKKPQTFDEEGNPQPGLGFLDEGTGGRGGLGFL